MTKNAMDTDRNVLGGPLACCCLEPLTGFYRDGHCRTGVADVGSHVICAQVTDAFLQFSRTRGNDLITPRPELRFPGLRAGDQWCLCAVRWREALEAGVAPPVRLDATHERALDFVTREQLQAHALPNTANAHAG
jgi:uncharacterized protein (DUF2237 family)